MILTKFLSKLIYYYLTDSGSSLIMQARTRTLWESVSATSGCNAIFLKMTPLQFHSRNSLHKLVKFNQNHYCRSPENRH
jgi:hypothetical protein